MAVAYSESQAWQGFLCEHRVIWTVLELKPILILDTESYLETLGKSDIQKTGRLTR